MIPVVVMPDFDAGDYDRGWNDAVRHRNQTLYQSPRYQMGYEAYSNQVKTNAMAGPTYYGVGRKLRCPRCMVLGIIVEPRQLVDSPRRTVEIHSAHGIWKEDLFIFRWTEADSVQCSGCNFQWSGYEIRKREMEHKWD